MFVATRRLCLQIPRFLEAFVLSCILTFRMSPIRLDDSTRGQKLSQHRILVHGGPSKVDNLPDQETIVVSAGVEVEQGSEDRTCFDLVRETKACVHRCMRRKWECMVNCSQFVMRKRCRNADQTVCFSGI